MPRYTLGNQTDSNTPASGSEPAPSPQNGQAGGGAASSSNPVPEPLD